jgi:hypothetical protein
VSRGKRVRKALLMLAVTLGFTAWALATLHSEGNLSIRALWWLLPFWALGLFQAYRYWTKTHVQELTPEAKQHQVAAEREEQRKKAERENKWYFRYPVAALALWAAW